MESLPLARPDRGRGQGEHAAAAAGDRLLLERRRADSLVGQGQRAPAWRSARALLPMMPHREDMVFIQGLYNQTAAVSTSPHLGRMNVLSGAPVSLDPNEIRVGTSMDQILAVADRQPHGDPEPGARHRAERAAARRRPVDDLRLEPVVGLADQAGDQGDLSLADVRPAGRRRHRPQARSQHPRRGAAGLAEPAARRSAAATTSSSSEYFESIRDIEKRIERASKEERLEGWRPTLTQPDMPRPANELPQNVPDHMKLMLDLIVLAFQMDKTRIATLMLNNDLSQMNFKFLEGVQGALHLDLTHNGRAADKEAMYLKTNQFHIAQFAYLTQRMKEIHEGDGTLLDNSILMLHLEPVRRRRPRRRPAADPAHRQGRRHAQARPHPRLPRQGRRQPQGVQPAPVADGPHGREAGSLRRRDDAARRAVGTVREKDKGTRLFRRAVSEILTS